MMCVQRFSLELTEMGPYVGAYSREGRHLLLGGRMGHLAAFDWLTKKLLCEINVKESVHAVQWYTTDDLLFLLQFTECPARICY